jgi:hypothetical protein
MPSLSLTSLEELQARPARRCDVCHHAVRPNYCRECDAFFEAGHMAPECADVIHDSHRTY